MLERAKAKGIPNFHIFGEVADDDFQPGRLALHTRHDRFPAVLDFAFKQAVMRSVAGTEPTEIWRNFFAQDVLYEGGERGAIQLPTFLGNHDQGRFGHYVRKAFPNASDAEQLARVKLANVLLFTARGVPTIYYGDEQGFAGDGIDQDAREDMFPSRTAVYNDNRLIASSATTAQSNFDTTAPLYRFKTELAQMRKGTPALRHGSTRLRAVEDTPGLLAFSRMHEGKEVLVAVNTSGAPLERNVMVEVGSTNFDALLGRCPATASAPGSIRISLPAFGYAVCNAR
jgi:glycosidase